MKQKFIEWFAKANNGYAPSINADGSFEHENTQHMFEAYQAGMAESDRKVEQLAAENGALKKYIGDECYVENIRTGIYTCAGNDMPETPATDAILAEVRASAIDSIVDIKMKQLGDMHPDTHAFGATAMSIRSQINELQVFATQLRERAAK